MQRHLFAVPPQDDQPLVQFYLFEQVKYNLVQSETFCNDERNVVGFELDDRDNRVVKFKRFEAATNWMVERHLTFSSVYDRNYFAELFFHGTKERRNDPSNDLRVMVMTYN